MLLEFQHLVDPLRLLVQELTTDRLESRLCLPSSSTFCLWTLTTTSWTSPEPVDVEDPLNAEIQVTWFSKWQLFFVGLAVPMQANLEDTVEDDDALYQKLISKSIDADTSGPDSTFRGQKATLCWWLCWMCRLNIWLGDSDRLQWKGLGFRLVLTSRYGGWYCNSCHHWCYLSCWNTSDMVSKA